MFETNDRPVVSGNQNLVWAIIQIRPWASKIIIDQR